MRRAVNSPTPSRGRIAGAAIAVLAIGFVTVHHFNKVEEEDDAALRGESTLTKEQQCQECEKTKCGQLAARCTTKECKDVYACIQKENCGDKAQEDFSKCYCGTTDKTACFVGDGTPNGPCKAVMEKAASTDVKLEVGKKYYDLNVPLGQAVQMSNCRMTTCPTCE
jgi:hypothetical protein